MTGKYEINDKKEMVITLSKDEVEELYIGMRRAVNNEDLEGYFAVNHIFSMLADGYIDILKAGTP